VHERIQRPGWHTSFRLIFTKHPSDYHDESLCWSYSHTSLNCEGNGYIKRDKAPLKYEGKALQHRTTSSFTSACVQYTEFPWLNYLVNYGHRTALIDGYSAVKLRLMSPVQLKWSIATTALSNTNCALSCYNTAWYKSYDLLKRWWCTNRGYSEGQTYKTDWKSLLSCEENRMQWQHGSLLNWHSHDAISTFICAYIMKSLRSPQASALVAAVVISLCQTMICHLPSEEGHIFWAATFFCVLL